MISFTMVSKASQRTGVKALVYGQAGVGKTVLAATLPSPILISAESGILSLRKENLERLFGSNNPQVCYDVPLAIVTKYEDFEDIYKWCLLSNEAKYFHSIGLDSLSEIAEVVLNTTKTKMRDPRQAYGALIEKMETLIRQFRDLSDKHVYMTSKMEPMKDELSGLIKYGPSMPGSKLSQKMAYFFDEVFQIGINKTSDGKSYRFLRTQPDIQYEAKDRSGALAPMEIPNLSVIIRKITGN